VYVIGEEYHTSNNTEGERGIEERIYKPIVIVKPHDTWQCNAFGDIERLSEMGSPLIGKGTPPETFTES
jgi:hypothetical protein